MKIKLKNLGILKQAEFEVGDLTIICGQNNTGKTYATYALFGFLYSWKKTSDIDIKSTIIDEVLTEGVAHIDILEYWKNHQEILNKICLEYSKRLSEIFAANEDRFKDSDFQVFLDISQDILDIEFTNEVGSSEAKTRFFSVIKEQNSPDISITLLTEEEKVKIPREIIKKFISESIKTILFQRYIPRSFIASAERTGTAIFRKELNFARNRMLEELSQVGKDIDPLELLLKGYDDYALPIKTNVDFTRNLETTAKKKSQLSIDKPNFLEDFYDIIGGQYTVTKNDELYFVPKNNKKVRLTMDESSSAVRSLLDIGFYLKHIAQKGDLLMIDEPELNLHPENQRRIARLLAKLVNYGIKVYITTHSDYIIKEFNTLIMLNSDKSHIKRIAEEEGYTDDELLDINQLKVYIAGEDLIKVEGKARRLRCQTLIPADINQEFGIEISSFDRTIDTMNRIQEAIVWGESL